MITADYDAPDTHTVHFHTTDWPVSSMSLLCKFRYKFAGSGIYDLTNFHSYMSCEYCQCLKS